MMKKVIPTDSVLIPESATKVFKGVVFDVYQWSLERFDGSASTWEMLKRPDTTAAICIVDSSIIVIEEEQPHSGKSIAFPGGRADMDKNVLAAVQREVLEEVGYSFNNWRLISVSQPHTKLEWFIHIFVAWDVTLRVEQSLDAGEMITAKLLPFEEVKQLSQSGQKYIHESRNLFENTNSIEELLALPKFEGLYVDR